MKRIEDIVNKIHCADCLDFMKEMPDECVDMVITSPPYWGLRDYGIEQVFGGDKDCGHEWYRKIKKWHSDRGSGPRKEVFDDSFQIKGTRDDVCIKCQAWKGQLGLEPTPEMYIEHLTEIFNEAKRVLKKEGTLWLNIGDTYGGSSGGYYPHEEELGASKAYIKFKGANKPKCLLMVPERLAWSLIQNGWILRNKNIWHKRNSMPSSVTDRFSNTYEFVYMFSKSQGYYFDLDSAREPHKYDGRKDTLYKGTERDKVVGSINTHERWPNPQGKNPGDVWIINTQPCPVKGIHFATFPEELCKKAIIPGCPEGGIVLDPFCGIGTACYVARRLGRRFIGIDIKPEYCDKAENIRLAQGVL